MAFLNRLRNLKRPLICAEGYLFEMERRGWVQFGPFVPEVVLNDPSAIKQLHREFVRCGSDVIEAFTYYAHREKMELIGKGDLVTDLNKKAIEIAFEVQHEFIGELDELPLIAGNICNSTIYDPNDFEVQEIIKSQYREQMELFKQYNVDYVVAETYDHYGEALLALNIIKEYDLASTITMSSIFSDGITGDGMSPTNACKKLKENGANVVGLNCSRGPNTMLPIIKDIKKELGDSDDVYIAALPVCYRTDKEYPTMQAFGNIDEKYLILDCHTCTRGDLYLFAKECMELGVNYIGTCCGGAPHHIRAMAEAVGKDTIASKYSADLSKHFAFSQEDKVGRLKTHFLDTKDKWGQKDTKYV
eukprot:207108_1